MNLRRRAVGAAIGALAWGLLCGTAATRAQGRMHRIGYLSARTTFGERDAAFVQGLQELGYEQGRNLAIEFRWAANDLARLPALAGELARQRVDVIVTATTAGTRAAMGATTTIPIVFAAASDPVAAGLVASLGRPGGNVTGLSLQTTDAARKRLQMARELVPGARRIGLLVEQTSQPGTTDLLVAETGAAAAVLGVELRLRGVGHRGELDAAMAWFEREGCDALVVQVSPLTLQSAARIVALAARERLPALYEARDFVDAGGLASYGPDLLVNYRRAATYVHRILEGARPQDMPVEQPRLSLAINMRAAQALGLVVPQTLLLRADEVLR